MQIMMKQNWKQRMNRSKCETKLKEFSTKWKHEHQISEVNSTLGLSSNDHTPSMKIMNYSRRQSKRTKLGDNVICLSPEDRSLEGSYDRGDVQTLESHREFTEPTSPTTETESVKSAKSSSYMRLPPANLKYSGIEISSYLDQKKPRTKCNKRVTKKKPN